MKKRVSVRRRQSQLRQAKAYVISVLGEFAQTCWSKQVEIHFKYTNICVSHQSLVGSVVIDTEHGRKNHSLIPATAIESGLKPFYVRTDPRTRLNRW
jgi:hypothetical protein